MLAGFCFTASIAGEMVAPREAVYAATKAFVLSYAHDIHRELKETNIATSDRRGTVQPTRTSLPALT